jgi:hypothetical protein
MREITAASLALVLWAALEQPERNPFIVKLADMRSRASLNAASVQNQLRNNDLILRDYGHLEYRKIDDPRPEPTLESDEDRQAMNCSSITASASSRAPAARRRAA